jgi:hypothetical protein
VSVNGTLVEDKMPGFKGEYAHFRFNKCPIYTHDGASAKFSTNSHETDNSVVLAVSLLWLASLHAVALLLMQAFLLWVACLPCWPTCCCFYSFYFACLSAVEGSHVIVVRVLVAGSCG